MKKALYSGSFDPITNGHIDILKQSSKIFDKIIICIFNNSMKKTMFSLKQRLSFIKLSTKDFKNIEIEYYDGLLIDFLQERDIFFIIRGLRNLEDFNYEIKINDINKNLYKNFENVYFISNINKRYINSSLVKELINYKFKKIDDTNLLNFNSNLLNR